MLELSSRAEQKGLRWFGYIERMGRLDIRVVDHTKVTMVNPMGPAATYLWQP